MAQQEKQLSTIQEGKGAVGFSPKVNTTTVYDENGQPLNVILKTSNGKLKDCADAIGKQRNRTDNLQDALEQASFHEGITQSANQIELASGTGLEAVTAQQAFAELATEVFPLQVEIGTNNAGTYETGTSVTPSVQLNITRRGNVVTPTSVTPSSGTYDSSTNTVTDSAITSGTKTINIAVVQGGQTKTASAQWKFMNYLYAGDIGTSTLADATAVKNKIESSWRNSNKSLSEATTKSSTSLAASHYYLFAVKGSVNLVVRDAATNGVISGCTTGSGLSVARVNGPGNDNYSWVIVPASSNSWNFKITNS